jgi:hypothetical protein
MPRPAPVKPRQDATPGRQNARQAAHGRSLPVIPASAEIERSVGRSPLGCQRRGHDE